MFSQKNSACLLWKLTRDANAAFPLKRRVEGFFNFIAVGSTIRFMD